MKKMRLVIDEMAYTSRKLEPAVLRVIEFCRKLPEGKALTTDNAARAIELASLRHLTKHPALQPYTTKVRWGGSDNRIWANEQTIVAVKRGDY